MAKSLDVVVAIASITNKGGTIGYRLAHVFEDKTDTDVKNIPTRNIIDAIEQGMEVENLMVVNGKLYGSQGGLESLPVVDLNGRLLAGSKVTIAYKIGDVGFRVVNYAGKALKLRDDEIIDALKTNRISGLTNAKIVTEYGIDRLVAVNGEFKQVRLKNTAEKVGRIKSSDLYEKSGDRVKYSSTVNMNNAIVRNEIDYNDSFYQLTKAQRLALESYYTWWTSETFRSLSEGGRAELQSNPKKVAQLAELRGKDIIWTYEKSLPARLINKQGFDYCTLGHKLQMVHFAKGIDKQGNVYQIKFGSTCAADFFNISPKSMTTLQKVSDTMKEEIELAVHEVGDPELLRAKIDKLKTMRSIFTNYPGALVLFGQNLVKFGYAFLNSGLPFPASFLALCRKEAYKYVGEKAESNSTDNLGGTLKLASWFYGLASNSKEMTKVIYDALIGRDNRMLQAFAVMFIEPGLEGCYGYDPINKIGERGKGRFDATARGVYASRYRQLRKLNCDVNSDLAKEFYMLCEYMRYSMEFTGRYFEKPCLDLYNELKTFYNFRNPDGSISRLNRSFAWIIGDVLRDMRSNHKGEDMQQSIIRLLIHGVSRLSSESSSLYNCLSSFPVYNNIGENMGKTFRSDREQYLASLKHISESDIASIIKEFIKLARESHYYRDLTGGMSLDNIKKYGDIFVNDSTLELNDKNQFIGCVRELLESVSAYDANYIKVISNGQNVRGGKNIFLLIASIMCHEYIYGPEKTYDVVSSYNNLWVKEQLKRYGLASLEVELGRLNGRAESITDMASTFYFARSIGHVKKFIALGDSLTNMEFARRVQLDSSKALKLLDDAEKVVFARWSDNGFKREDADAITLSRIAASKAAIMVCGLLGLYGWTHADIGDFYEISKPTFEGWDSHITYWTTSLSDVNKVCIDLIKKEARENIDKTQGVGIDDSGDAGKDAGNKSTGDNSTGNNIDINSIYKKSRSLSDEDNWKMSVDDIPEIKRAVEILSGVDKELLPPFINRVLVSVKRKGVCSYKQWMYLRAFANQYRGDTPEIPSIG